MDFPENLPPPRLPVNEGIKHINRIQDIKKKMKLLNTIDRTTKGVAEEYRSVRTLPESTTIEEISQLLQVAQEDEIDNLFEACFNKLVEFIQSAQETPWIQKWWLMEQIQYFNDIYGNNRKLREALHFYKYRTNDYQDQNESEVVEYVKDIGEVERQ